MIQSATYLLTEIERKFQDKNGNIFIDTTWEPEQYATLQGKVISAPTNKKVKVGDNIFFGFRVIFDYVAQPDNDTPIYRNLLLYEGKEYWKVSMTEVFCVICSNGDLKMITDNILLEPQSEDTGIIKAMPDIKLSCNVRDVVCFEPKFVQKYNILGKEHYIIPSRKVLAKV